MGCSSGKATVTGPTAVASSGPSAPRSAAAAGPKKAPEPGATYEWYFAIASMMNSVAITSREVYPIESVPAEI